MCEKAGNSVSVAVVDRAGRLRAFLQGDKAAPHNIELAQRKAYTARTFSRSSAEWAERTGPTSELAGQRQLEHVIALRGGIPIKVGEETIGAVGVSGSSSQGDEACAMAGVAKVADIHIAQPWARATPKGATTGAAYMTITNNGTAPDKVSCVVGRRRGAVPAPHHDDGAGRHEDAPARRMASRSSPAKPSSSSRRAFTSCSPD